MHLILKWKESIIYESQQGVPCLTQLPITSNSRIIKSLQAEDRPDGRGLEMTDVALKVQQLKSVVGNMHLEVAFRSVSLKQIPSSTFSMTSESLSFNYIRQTKDVSGI